MKVFVTGAAGFIGESATRHARFPTRVRGVRRIAFSSTGSIYGEAVSTSEGAPFPAQTSFYDPVPACRAIGADNECRVR